MLRFTSAKSSTWCVLGSKIWSIFNIYTFQPGADAYSVIPKTQLIVARTAYKNNSSKYTVNGRMSTYSDVQGLLKEKGIDLDHNRFLILQVCHIHGLRG